MPMKNWPHTQTIYPLNSVIHSSHEWVEGTPDCSERVSLSYALHKTSSFISSNPGWK